MRIQCVFIFYVRIQCVHVSNFYVRIQCVCVSDFYMRIQCVLVFLCEDTVCMCL